MVHVQNNQERSRYELLDADEPIAVMSYTVNGDTVTITHTEVDRAHRGRGHAEQLVQEALDDIRDTEMYVQPLCSYVRRFITDHPDYADLVKEA
jgi:predicted GNAT family acetyltransferase